MHRLTQLWRIIAAYFVQLYKQLRGKPAVHIPPESFYTSESICEALECFHRRMDAWFDTDARHLIDKITQKFTQAFDHKFQAIDKDEIRESVWASVDMNSLKCGDLNEVIAECVNDNTENIDIDFDWGRVENALEDTMPRPSDLANTAYAQIATGLNTAIRHKLESAFLELWDQTVIRDAA